METVHDMLDAIYPDPYETEIGRAILNSTNVSQTDEDWAQIIRVCELVNSSQEGPSLAIRAMTRLITPNPDHPITTHQQILAMSVLEALVKNCGRRFHHQLTWRPFIRAVRNSLEDQVSMPILVQDRLKSMLQSWALVFATEPDLKPLCDLYAELRSTIDFPTEDLISSPISTRPTQDCGSDDTGRLNPDETGFASTARNVLSSIRQRAANAFSSISTQSPQPAKSTTASTSPRLDKIRSELSVVDEHVRIMNEMINIVRDAENVSEADKRIMKDLYSACKEMHRRIVDLVGYVDNCDIVAQLLAQLDHINSAIFAYDELDHKLKESNEANVAKKEEEDEPKKETEEKKDEDNDDDAPLLLD